MIRDPPDNPGVNSVEQRRDWRFLLFSGINFGDAFEAARRAWKGVTVDDTATRVPGYGVERPSRASPSKPHLVEFVVLVNPASFASTPR